MAEKNRVLDPRNVQEISNRIQEVRKDLLDRYEKAIGETTIFAMAAVNAIGEISIHEAEQGIIDFFKEKLRNR